MYKKKYFVTSSADEYTYKLKFLIIVRTLFATLILSYLLWQNLKKGKILSVAGNEYLFSLVGLIYLLSIVYTLIFVFFGSKKTFPFFQILIDTFIATLLIYSTGSYNSLYSFIYLIVIISTSIFFNRRITLFIALICSIQFGMMIDLEYYGIISSPFTNANLLSEHVLWSQAFNKILITMVACCATAVLSSLISEQEKKAKNDLMIMQEHVKRVEKLAAAGEIAAGLAHEIKNPLASLSGSIQMLSEIVDYHPEYDRLIHISLREAERLTSLVDDFMQFAKPLKGGKNPLKVAPVVDETIELLMKDRKLNNKISIHRDFNYDLWVRIDSGHLKQIVLNLLLNASDVTPENGNVFVKIYSKNKYLSLSVKDEGPGVPEENRNQIFNPFFTTRPKGAGLGLSIVHRITNSYDGNIELRNNKDSNGAEFIINLPEVTPPHKYPEN